MPDRAHLQLCMCFPSVLSSDCLCCVFNFFLEQSPPSTLVSNHRPSPPPATGWVLGSSLLSQHQSVKKPHTVTWFYVVCQFSTPVVKTETTIQNFLVVHKSSKDPAATGTLTPTWRSEPARTLYVSLFLRSLPYSINKHISWSRSKSKLMFKGRFLCAGHRARYWSCQDRRDTVIPLDELTFYRGP